MRTASRLEGVRAEGELEAEVQVKAEARAKRGLRLEKGRVGLGQ